MEWPGPGSPAGWWALTGTPGTGKSTVRRALFPGVVCVELADLDPPTGARPADGRPISVDLDRLSRLVRSHPLAEPVVVVGHLSHLLPIPRAIVLRCHPKELDQRLRPRPTLPRRERAENCGSEAIGLITAEARRDGRWIAEVDTTGRSARAVADDVRRCLRGKPPRSSTVDWLSDPSVPEFLLRGAR